MPYPTIDSLPDAVKKLSKKKQRIWRAAWNAAHKKYKDETRAFKIAWSTVGKEATMPETLTLDNDIQITGLFEATTLDAQKNKARVVVIRAGKSKNGNVYPEDVLSVSVPLFEGAKVFLDHTDIKPMEGNRSVRELVGYIEHPTFYNGRLEADLHTIDTEAGRAAIEIIRESIASRRNLVGMSVNIRARVKADSENAEAYNVEEIVEVRSVDLVVDPSAGGEILRIYESVQTDTDTEVDEMTIKELTLEELKKERPDLLQSIAEEVEARVYGNKDELAKEMRKLTEAVKRSEEEAKKMADELKEWQSFGAVKQTEAYLERKLKEAELPEIAEKRVRKLFEGRSAKDDEVDTAVKEEKDYIAQLTDKNMVKHAGNRSREDDQERLKEQRDEKQRKIFEAMGYGKEEIDKLMKIER